MSETTRRSLVDIAMSIAATTSVEPTLLSSSWVDENRPAATGDELADALQYLYEHESIINAETPDERTIILDDLYEVTIIDDRGDEYDVRVDDVSPGDYERYAACQLVRVAVAMNHLRDALAAFTALRNAARVSA